MNGYKCILSAVVLSAFGLNSALGAYLMGVNESYVNGAQTFSLNVFDPTESGTYATYTGGLPAELDNIVQANDTTLYGWLGQDNGSKSTLYKFILDNETSTVSSYAQNTFSNVSQFDSLAIAGDKLYAWGHSGTVDGSRRRVAGLYSIDLTADSLVATREMSNSSLYNVESMTYDSTANKLYLSDYKYFDGQNSYADSYLYSIDLSQTELSAAYVGTMDINDPEGMAVADDGQLYIASGSSLYSVDKSTGFVSQSVTLGWATTIEGLTSFSNGVAVPEPASVMVWLLVVGGTGCLVRRKRALA